jgi:hypothetical protein
MNFILALNLSKSWLTVIGELCIGTQKYI